MAGLISDVLFNSIAAGHPALGTGLLTRLMAVADFRSELAASQFDVSKVDAELRALEATSSHLTISKGDAVDLDFKQIVDGSFSQAKLRGASEIDLKDISCALSNLANAGQSKLFQSLRACRV